MFGLGKLKTATAAVAMLALAGPAMAQSNTATPLDSADVVSMSGWTYDDLYAGGVSAYDIIDQWVYDVNGEQIGDVEDMLIGPDGQVLSIVAEVGGFWDIGDTHISVPFEQVEVTPDNRIVIPVTEETVDDYDFDRDFAVFGDFDKQMVAGLDDRELARAWRVSELVGDYARLTGNGDTARHYGYVNDLILRDGKVAAVVVQPTGAYGAGYYAYPYYGYNPTHGWNPGSPYYDLPVDETEVTEAEPFEYERM